MPTRRRKRCPFCHCLFWPDRRTEWRQWACRKAECQAQRRVESQRRWRAKNPSDGSARQYRAAVATAKAGEAAPGHPPTRGILARLPWEEAKDEIEPEVLVMLALFGRLLIAAARDEKREQAADFTLELARLVPRSPEDETDREGAPP